MNSLILFLTLSIFPGYPLSFLWPEWSFAAAGLQPIIQWSPAYPYYSQAMITSYRISPVGLFLLILLFLILIAMVGAGGYLLFKFKKRLEEVEKKDLHFDQTIKELYKKQKDDLDSLLQHVNYILKKSERKEEKEPDFEKDTAVRRKILEQGKLP